MNPVNTVLSIPHLVINIAEQCPDVITLCRLSKCNKDFYSWIKVDNYLDKYKLTEIRNNITYEYIMYGKRKIKHGEYSCIEHYDATCITYSKRIEISNYYKGLQEGIEYVYYNNGCLSQVQVYKKGKECGTHQIYGEDEYGNNYLLRQYEMYNAERNGPYYTFDIDGNIIDQCIFVDDAAQGPYMETKDKFSSYKVIEYGTYVNGRKHGEFTCFIEVDNKHIIFAKGHYNDNQLHGNYREYNINGTLVIDCYYHHGDLHGIYKNYSGRYFDTLDDDEFKGIIIQKHLYIAFYNMGCKREPTETERINLLLQGINIYNGKHSDEPYQYHMIITDFFVKI